MNRPSCSSSRSPSGGVPTHSTSTPLSQRPCHGSSVSRPPEKSLVCSSGTPSMFDQFNLRLLQTELLKKDVVKRTGWQLCPALTSVPVAASLQVVLLPDAPSEAACVPEDVPGSRRAKASKPQNKKKKLNSGFTRTFLQTSSSFPYKMCHSTCTCLTFCNYS